MAKTMQITHDGKQYTLEYTRDSLRQMAYRYGFDFNALGKSPVVVFDLFKGAFIAHHSDLDDDQIEEIFKCLKNKTELVENLATMYLDPVASLFDHFEDGQEGNATWGVNW